MTPSTYALYRQTLAQLADECGRRPADDEAIAMICRRALEPASAATTERAPYQIALTICQSCERGWQDGAGAVIEVERAVIEVARCDAQHIGSLDAAAPARAYQDITPAVRRLVSRRDHGRCRVTGCRSARNLDVHHVQRRADGGGHDPANLALMCSGCHLALHRGLLVVTGSAPDFVFTHLLEVATAPIARTLVEPGPRPPTAPTEVAEPSQTAPTPESTPAAPARTPASASAPAPASPRSPTPTASATPSERVEPTPHASVESSRLTAITLRVQARDVLTASGFAKHEANAAVDAAMAHVGTAVSLEQLLREAFRRCRRPSG